MKNALLQNVKIGCKILYKTCRLWRLLEPFSENGSEKEPKSIRFFTKSDICFHQVEKPYKTKGKLVILRVPFRSKSSFWQPCRRKSHRVQKGAQLEVWIFQFFEKLSKPIWKIFQIKFIKKFLALPWGNHVTIVVKRRSTVTNVVVML